MQSTAIECEAFERALAEGSVRFRTLAAVEQEIKRAGVRREVTPEQPARLEPDSPGPFEAGILHPARRALPAAGEETEQSTRGLDDADFGEPRGEFGDEGLLV